MQNQPLAKIRRNPRLLEMRLDHEIFGRDPADPEQSEERVAAAWTIQRAFRYDLFSHCEEGLC